MAIIILTGILFIFYLKDNLYEFIDLCILETKEFCQNGKIEILELIKNITLIVIAIVSMVIIRKNKIDSDQNIIILMCFAIGANLLVLPIINKHHVIMSSFLWEIIILYEIYQILKPVFEIKQVNNVLKTVSFILVLITIVKSISLTFIYNKNIRIFDKDSAFYGAKINVETLNEIEEVTKYINDIKQQGKNVKIFSSTAMFYSLNMELDNWYFDMPLIGNMGKNGEGKVINKIHTLENTVMLVENENFKSNYQFMNNVRQYVKNNYKKIDELYSYDVYEINNIT